MIPAKAKSVVVDSWAVIAYLEDEPPAGEIGELFAEANEAGIPLLMTVVNAGEIWYSVAREGSEAEADQSLKDIADLGIAIVEADWRLTRQAARFKAKGRIAYAGFCVVDAKPNRKAGSSSARNCSLCQDETSVDLGGRP